MDSLRYWVLEMHVDGFRFDLAAALAREFHSVDRLAAFFDLVNQDPVVSQVKLIAEPWDVGEGGYQVGGFPALWTEWNGKYRDTVRDFWRGEPAGLGEFASRFTGSSDLYEKDNRRPIASINFVTAHDGFTLHDLVSYNDKHNYANGEDNRDGESHNRSWNHGAEGPSDDGEIHALRERQKRNFIATLLLSQGVPMISHGDELGRTQHGNNNVYCQDNETSWVDWKAAREYSVLTEFTGEVAKLRAEHPVFRRRRFFQGRPIQGSNIDDIVWLRPDGQPMTEHDWHTGYARTLGVYLNGEGIPERDPLGARVVDDSFLLLFNAHHHATTFTLPSEATGGCGRSSWTPRTRCGPARRARSATPSRAGGCASRRGRCWCCSAGSDRSPVRRGLRRRCGLAACGRPAAVAECGGDRARPGLRPGRRRRRRAARRPGRRAARAPRSRGRARTAGRAPRRARRGRRPAPAAARPGRRPAARAHGRPSAPVSRVRLPSNRSSVERWRPACRTQACGARSPGRRGQVDPQVRRRVGAGDHRRAVRVAEAARQPVGRAALARRASASAAASPTGPRSASWLASSASPARPRATHASFQPSSWPSWIAVFRPIPATGVVRCAASPTRNPGPAR